MAVLRSSPVLLTVTHSVASTANRTPCEPSHRPVALAARPRTPDGRSKLQTSERDVVDVDHARRGAEVDLFILVWLSRTLLGIEAGGQVIDHHFGAREHLVEGKDLDAVEVSV